MSEKRKRKEAFLKKLNGFLRAYFRVEAEGLEHIPRRGPAIILPNHSGFAGADAVVLAYLIYQFVGRPPRLMVHRGYFRWFRWLKHIAESLGFQEATLQAGLKVLKKGQLLVVFPEGELGNFKPSSQRYHLQPFQRGFVQMAVEAGVPVIPCLVIGAEETHLNLGSIDLTGWVRGLRIPLPVNLFPLPAKWKIRFLPPLNLSGFPHEAIEDRKRLRSLAEKTRYRMQREINRELSRRQYIYFRRPRWLERALERGVGIIA